MSGPFLRYSCLHSSLVSQEVFLISLFDISSRLALHSTMHTLRFLVALFTAFSLANAWHFTAMTKNGFCGKRRTFYSATGDTGCYDIPDETAGKVNSLVYCTMPWTRCSITLHSKAGCKGDLLGSSDKSWPSIWEDKKGNDKKARTRSFRIQGCKKIGTTLDITKCYNGQTPWEKNSC